MRPESRAFRVEIIGVARANRGGLCDQAQGEEVL